MDEKKFAVLLTDTQDVKVVECDPQEEIFGIARGLIGCDWIELVEAEPLADKGYLMLLVDINEPKKPLIKLRTWQPEKDPNFGLYEPGDF